MRFHILLLGILLVLTGHASSFVNCEDSSASLTRSRRTIEPILDRLRALNLGLVGLLGLKKQESPKDVAGPQNVDTVESKPSVLVLSPTVGHLYGHKQQQAPKQQQQQQLNGIQQQHKEGNEQQQQKPNPKDQQHFFPEVQEEKVTVFPLHKPDIGSDSEEAFKQPTTSATYYAPVYTPPTQPSTTPNTRSTTTTTTTTTTTGTTTRSAPLRYHYSRLTSPVPSTPPASPLYRSQIHYPAQDPLPIQKELQDVHLGGQHTFHQHGLHKDQVDEQQPGDVHNRESLVTWLQAPPYTIDPHGYQNSNHFSEDLDIFTFEEDQHSIANNQPIEIRSSKRIPKEVSINEKPQQIFYTFSRPFKARSPSPRDKIGEAMTEGRRIDDLAFLDQQIVDEVFAEEKSPREEAKSRFKFFQPVTSSQADLGHLSSNGLKSSNGLNVQDLNSEPTSSLWSLAQHLEEPF